MLLYGTAIAAARRAAGEDRSEVVIVSGPPLWRLLLGDLAYGARTRWQRLVRFVRSARAVRSSWSADCISCPYGTNEPIRARGFPPTPT